ncbi:MAG TPA: hypothetical protein VHJ17_01385, partial [Thermomonospora sp.]|nr:hypothetical protein [Thermomonospora sp.]
MSSSSWWPGRAGLAVVAGCAVAVPLVCAPPAQASPGTVAAPAPVVVGRAAWAYVTKSRPAQVNLNRSVAAPVGRDGRARTTYRSFFRLDLRPLAGRSPAKATLRIPAVFPARCGTRAPAVEIWETTGFDGRTSWNRQPQWRKRLAAVRPACADKRYTLDVSR